MRIAGFVNVAACALVALAAAGCSREDKNAAPVAQTQTQTPVQPTEQPAVVSGCLRAGEAEGTFVLTTSGTDAATYHLAGTPNVNLVDHIGRQVEVEGIVRAQQQTTTQSVSRPADKTVGTGGTPRIETRAELDMKHMDVKTVRPLGERCDK